MSNKLKKKKTTTSQDGQDSVFKEAWQNLPADMSRFMPEFITKRRLKGKGKVWVVVVVTLVELLILGVVGKFVYDWLLK